MLNPAIQVAYRRRASAQNSEQAVGEEDDGKSAGYASIVWSTGARAIGAVVSTSTSILSSTGISSSTRP